MHLQKPLSPFTEAYRAPGWFTGVRSRVTIPRPADVVFASLATDLHKVFTAMTECEDEVEEDDGEGKQRIFRVVRIPFRVRASAGRRGTHSSPPEPEPRRLTRVSMGNHAGGLCGGLPQAAPARAAGRQGGRGAHPFPRRLCRPHSTWGGTRRLRALPCAARRSTSSLPRQAA